MTEAQIEAGAAALFGAQSGLGEEAFERYRLRDRFIADARVCIEAALAAPAQALAA